MNEKKVLFVDDEENILSSIRRGLIDEDYECLFALNGMDALEIIKNNSISVIVTDMRMPKMDGLTLLKEVKKISPSTIRIVLSGYTQLQQILATINQVDIFKFITKPWKLEEEFKVIIYQALEYYTLLSEREKLNKALENRNTAYHNILKNIDDRILAAKNESNIIKQTSKMIFEHLFKIIDNNIKEDKSNINYEFERDFCRFYSENIASEIEELNVSSLLDNFISSLVDYNKQLKVKEDFTFPENYKIKTNKIIVDCLMKYILMSIINSNDSYTMNIHGDIKHNLDSDIIEFIFDILDLKNVKIASDNNFHFINQGKIEFVSIFMNEYLKAYNGAFKIRKIDSRLIIKIQFMN